uniref:Uncharacterized protein n=1 Tax=Gibberella zeae TaxID=5518 RepID=A0A4E9E9G8_GIBZA
MCYYDQIRWTCGYWRWSYFRQHCTKEYRVGETCGLKLVYETKFEPGLCRLCCQTEKKQSRYAGLSQDLERWGGDTNRTAAIEQARLQMEEVADQIHRMRKQHDCRVEVAQQSIPVEYKTTVDHLSSELVADSVVGTDNDPGVTGVTTDEIQPIRPLTTILPDAPVFFGDPTQSSFRVDRDDIDDDLSSDGSGSCMSSSTAPTSVSGGGGPGQREANEAFIDLLYNTVDLRKLIHPSLYGKETDRKQLVGKLRKLLKLLGQDLEAEIRSSESTRMGVFFRKSSKQLSSEIIIGLSKEERGYEERVPRDREIDAVSEDDELVESDSGDEADIRPNMPGLKSLIASTNSFCAFITRLVDFVDPSFEARLKRLAKSKTKGMNGSDIHHITEVISELSYSKPKTINLSEYGGISWIRKSMASLMAALPGEWDWWPLNEPRRQPLPNCATLTWTCVCGDIRREVVPKTFARGVIKIREQTLPMSSPPCIAPPEVSMADTKPSPTPSGSHSLHIYPQKSMQDPTPFTRTSIVSDALPVTISMPSTSRYIMFFVNSGGLQLRPIESKSLCNEQLFCQLRAEYRQAKGWFKTWFGLMTFSHCDFHQFEQWHEKRYCERRSGVPPLCDKDYYYQPRPLDEPPLSRHEFYDRFHGRIDSEACIVTRQRICNECDAVDRIPQKKELGSFIGEKRPRFYGIIAREKKSGLRVVVYILVSCIPGLMFFFLWLFWKRESLQEASVLLMLSFSLLGILYAAQLF